MLAEQERAERERSESGARAAITGEGTARARCRSAKCRGAGNCPNLNCTRSREFVALRRLLPSWHLLRTPNGPGNVLSAMQAADDAMYHQGARHSKLKPRKRGRDEVESEPEEGVQREESREKGRRRARRSGSQRPVVVTPRGGNSTTEQPTNPTGPRRTGTTVFGGWQNECRRRRIV